MLASAPKSPRRMMVDTPRSEMVIPASWRPSGGCRTAPATTARRTAVRRLDQQRIQRLGILQGPVEIACCRRTPPMTETASSADARAAPASLFFSAARQRAAGSERCRSSGRRTASRAARGRRHGARARCCRPRTEVRVSSKYGWLFGRRTGSRAGGAGAAGSWSRGEL